MDIVGIIILVKLLFRIVFKNEDDWNKQYKKILDDYKIAMQEHQDRRYSIPKDIPDDLALK